MSPIMTSTPKTRYSLQLTQATCQSMLGRNRVLPYHWKGMNEEQRQAILLEQERQRK